jgi:CubicO group peptidase (beta-lactamase class C family)
MVVRKSSVASPLASLADRVHPVLDPVVAKSPNRGAGVVFFDSGNITFATFGHRGDDAHTLPDADTTFEIGSVSKFMAGLLLSDATLRGEVDLHVPAQKYLPSDLALPTPHGRPITLEDLAIHRSGLPYAPTDFIGPDPATNRTRYHLAELRKFLSRYELTAAPGERYEYSNLGPALVAIALANRSNTDWGTFLAQRLFAPLGMSRSGYVDHDNARLDDNALVGFDEDSVRQRWRVDTSPLGPCCAVRSTLADMGKLLRAVLDPSSPFATAFTQLARPIAPAHQGEGDFTGLGAIVWPREGLVWKDGQVAGYRCVFALLPERHRGFFAVVNSEAVDIEDIGMKLVDRLLDPSTSIPRTAHASFVAPADTHPSATASGLVFANSIRFEGWDAPTTAHPGEHVRVVLYFRCIAPVPRDWRVFVHADASAPEKSRLHLDHFPGSETDSTAFWQPGELIRDTVEFVVPEKARFDALDLSLGFYRGNVRMEASDAAGARVARRVAAGPHIQVTRSSM